MKRLRGIQKMRLETLPYNKVEGMVKNYGRMKGKRILSELMVKKNALVLALSLLLSRASLAGSLFPFGIAAYASALDVGVSKILLAGSIILGMATVGGLLNIYIFTSAALLITALTKLFKGKDSSSNFRYAVIAFVSVLIPEMVITYVNGLLLYDILLSLFYSFIVFSLVFIFRNASALLSSNRNKYALTNEEMISVSIILALALSGFSDTRIAGMLITNVLSILIILTFSFKCGPGVGAAAGVTIGLIINMSTTSTPLIIGSYAFCGLLSGVFRKLGKMGTALGFIMGNAVLTLYLNGSTDTIIYLKEIVAAIIIFVMIPQKLMELVAGQFVKQSSTFMDKASYNMRVKEIAVDKLKKFSAAFGELARTFNEISQTKVVTNKQDITLLFDRVADRVCKDCSLCLHCWDRNFYNTYQVMFKIIEKLEDKGHIEASDIPSYFINRCERINDFVEAVNNIYELFKLDVVWQSKIGESRGLVSQQLHGLSKVISNLASEIDMDINFNAELEDKIVSQLNKIGLKVSDAMVFENKWGKYEINIFHRGCEGKRACATVIEKVISDIVGRKMVKESDDCYRNPENDFCNIKFVEEEAFRVTTGVARLPKYDGTVSGDNYTFMNTGDGKYIVALSDGMGSGQKAASQSRAAINLLEQFIEAGFDKDTTIKLINSILILKSDDDSFATIDMSVIDLYSSEVEFVKVGAVPTYIKREDSVEVVKSVSLPAGILSDLEMELMHKKLTGGDFLIMMSDGIIDSFKEENGGEKALQEYIKNIKSTNPQEIADRILDKAYENSRRKPADDMMVLVAKVWERSA